MGTATLWLRNQPPKSFWKLSIWVGRGIKEKVKEKIGLIMTDQTAAIWSAIAASFSAIAAITVMWIQKTIMLDAARPELILDGWKRETKKNNDSEIDIITFNNIRNVGKGSAFHVLINASQVVNSQPTYTMPTNRLSFLPANEDHDITGKISLLWENVKPTGILLESIPIKIKIYAWCSKSHRHITTYNLTVTENKEVIFPGSDIFLDGVSVSNRHTISMPMWKFKIQRKLSQIPIIEKYFTKDHTNFLA